MDGFVPRLRARIREQDGFTLVELIVVVAILGIVVGALTQLFTSGANSAIDQANRVQAQQDARVALDRMRREIHCASSATSNQASAANNGTYPAQAVTIVLPDYCPTYSSSLSFKLNGVSVNEVTWCTSSTSPYTLYRYTHLADVTTSAYASACSGTGTAFAKDIVDSGSVTGGQIFTGYTTSTQPAMQAPDFNVSSSTSVTDCDYGTKVSGVSSGTYDCAYGYVVDPVVSGVQQPGLEGVILLYQAQIGGGGTITVTWANACPPYANTATNNAITKYEIYGRAPGGEEWLHEVTEAAGSPCGTTSWTDAGTSLATPPTPPSGISSTPVASQFTTLGVALPIEATSGGKQAFAELTDDITLRNTPR